ncbi:hypothetical protein [Vibrio agarivorans]|uniref:hypothetical protein n=1 Tax=Vibrio agarivorans TaxID=153622 RepID=UPI0025B4EF6D|nr:hypothetical protein [Vibrio agarivorans]MDN3661069.1 hypothetical protein [Vibrio agarivorans]
MCNLLKKIHLGFIMLFMFHIPNALATTEGSRSLLDGVKDARTLTQESGGLMYDAGITIGIALIVIGIMVFGISSRAQGDQSKTKGAAAIMFVAGIALTGITAFTNMGTQTLTGQQSEMSAFLGDNE